MDLAASLSPASQPLVGLLRRFVDDCEEAWATSSTLTLPAGWRRPRRVIALGVGGSGVGAEVAESFTRRHSALSIETWRDEGIPPVDDDTLVIACSFSGNTVETAEPFRALVDRGRGMFLAITGGGALAALAGEYEVPVAPIPHVGPPRFAFPYILLPIISVLRRLDLAEGNLTPDALDRLRAAAAVWEGETDPQRNLARRLGAQFTTGLPVILGAGTLRPVARRWQAQLSENAKRLAIAGEFPEAAHNLVEALGDAATPPSVVVIADGMESVHAGNHLRAAGLPVDVLEFPGDPLERVLAATLLGDWISLYVAAHRGAEMSVTPHIDLLRVARGVPAQSSGRALHASVVEHS